MSDNQQPSSECRKCGKSQALDQFKIRLCSEDRMNGVTVDKCRRYRRHICIMCEKTHKKGLSKIYYKRNKKRIMKRITAYRRAHPESYRNDSNKRARRFRDMVIKAYGGYLCVCCGETEPSMLTLDHMNGGGTKHRAALAKEWGWKHTVSGVAFNRHLAELGFPSGFQVLCFNCNYSKHLGGVCAHKLREGSTIIP